MSDWTHFISHSAPKALVVIGKLVFISAPAGAQGPVKLGILTDMSSIYTDNAGEGSVAAAQMAVEDSGKTSLGREIQIVAAHHQNKADLGSAIARRWLDEENVEVIIDVPNSAVTPAVQEEITRERQKMFLATGARAWARRFIARPHRVPTMIHAGTYGAVSGYLNAVGAAGTLDGPAVAAEMGDMPVNDFMTRTGTIPRDGFRPMEEGGCPLLQN